MIWIVFALLTGAAVFSALWPLSRPAPRESEDSADVAFYRAQIAEIEAERERGAIDADQAEAAQAQAARRLLAAAPQEAGAPGAPRNRKIASVLALILIPLVALGVYRQVGHPDEPDMPLEARLDSMPSRTDFAAAIAKMELHIAAHPDDARALELMAPIWERTGEFDKALRARENLLRLLGESPERLVKLAEAMAAANNGTFAPDAVAQLDKALKLDPKLPEARFYLGAAAAQSGDVEKARMVWRALAADLPEGSGPRKAVEDQISQLDAPAGQVDAPKDQSDAPRDRVDAPKGPLAEQVAQQPPQQQQQTIHAMVARLAARLAEKGGSVEEWSRLIRAYKVLNEEEKAKEALTGARKAYAQDAAALQSFDGEARDLGLDK
jgi:cytochrome c-type biogenesis protein CcmH